MTGAIYITQLCFSSNLARIVANKIEQSFYSVYSYSGIESIEHTLNVLNNSAQQWFISLLINDHRFAIRQME